MKNTNNENSNKKLKLVLSYLVNVVDRLSSVYNLSFEDACKAVEDLDLINLYKGAYEFILHENIMTWVDLAYKRYTRNKLQKPDDKVKLKFTGNDSSIDSNDTADTMLNDCKPIVLDNKVKIIMENAAPKHLDKNDRLQEGVDTLKNFKLSKQETKNSLSKILEEQKERLLHYKPEIWYKISHVQPTTKNTIAGDIVLYDNQIWFNTGNIVAPMLYADLEDWVDPDGTIRNTKKESNDTNMENYIMINGTKIELTKEQINQISDIANTCTSECKNENKNPFNDRPKVNDCFYYITSDGVRLDDDDDYNANMITAANSFNDEDFANQIYLHELLNRKLMKYAYDSGAEDVACDDYNDHFYIYLDCHVPNKLTIGRNTCHKNQGTVYFSNPKIAAQAIENVVKPFMKLNPDFVW